MSDLVATLEGLAADSWAPVGVGGMEEVSPQSFLNPLGLNPLGSFSITSLFGGEGLGNFNPTSNFYAPDGGDEDDQPMHEEDPPEQQADRAGRMAKMARAKAQMREGSACKMRERVQREVARVEKLDAKVAQSPPGAARNRLIRVRAQAAATAIRAAKTQAVAAVLARDSRRKEGLLRQYQSAAKRKDRAGMAVIGAAVRAVQGHEKSVKNVREAQQIKWKCGNAGFARARAQRELAEANASMGRIRLASASVAAKLNRLHNARPTVANRTEKARLERRQSDLDKRRAQVNAVIQKWTVVARDADRPCRNPRAAVPAPSLNGLRAVRFATQIATAGASAASLTTSAALTQGPLAPTVKQKIDQVGEAAQRVDGAVKGATKRAAALAAKAGKAGAKAGAKAVKALAKVASAEKAADSTAARMPKAPSGRGALIVVGLLAAGGAAAYALS